MKRGTVWLLCGVGGYFAFQALVLRDWLAGAIGLSASSPRYACTSRGAAVIGTPVFAELWLWAMRGFRLGFVRCCMDAEW